MNGKSCPWNLRDATGVFLLYLIMIGVGCPVILLLLEKILTVQKSAHGLRNILLFLTFIINIVICTRIFYLVSRKCPPPVTGNRLRMVLDTLGLSLRNWERYLPQGILLYLVAIPFILTAGRLVEYTVKALDGTPQQQEVITHFMEETSPNLLISLLFFGALFGPFTEEVLFRGFLQPALREVLGAGRAILLSSFLFALVHLDPYVFLQVFLLGLVLAYLFEKTGTLLASISVHIFHNTATLAYLLWNKQLAIATGISTCPLDKLSMVICEYTNLFVR